MKLSCACLKHTRIHMSCLKRLLSMERGDRVNSSGEKQSAYRFGRGLPKIPSPVLTAPSPFCPVSYSCHPKLSCWDRWCFQLQFCRCLQRRAQPFKASCGKRAFSGLCISSMSSFPRTSVVHIDLLGRTAVQDQAVFWTPLGPVLDLFPVVIWDPLGLKTSQGY